MTTFELGSQTAKGGFANEKAICKKINSWKTDKEAQQWLKIIGYNLKEIASVEAFHIPTRIKRKAIEQFELEETYEELMKFKKADAQVRIKIIIGKIVKIENLSLKKVTIRKNKPTSGFNQVDKRWIDSYREIWNFDDEITYSLKLYTGEIKPQGEIVPRLRDKRRMYLDEMPDHMKNKIVDFFKNNRILVICDVLKGRGGLSAGWMLVTRYDEANNITTWTLKDMNIAMNFFGSGDIYITGNGVLHIGRITVQRKGGDAGRPTANMLQFKIKPCELFNLR